MSFKDILKNVGLVEETPDEIKAETGSKPQQQNPVIPTITNYTPTVTPVTSNLVTNVGIVDQKYVDHFNQVLEDTKKANPDFDYMNFRKSMEATASSQGSLMENLRYQLIYGSLSVNGLTKDKLVSSIQSYLNALDEDNKAYASKTEDKKKTEIVKRQNDIVALNESNKTKNEQIQTLLKEIQDNQTSATTLQNEIVEQSNIIDQKQQNFSTTYNTFLTSIQNDLNKINQYIQ